MVYLMKTITTDRWVPRLERFPDGRSGQSYPVADFLAGTVDPKFDRPDYSATIDLRWGQRVPDELVWRVPEALYHFGPRRWKAMPDIMGNIINQKVFDIVERLDTGIHQFFPLEIIYKKSGKPYTEGGPFRFWNILRAATMPELFDLDQMRGEHEVVHLERINEEILLGGKHIREPVSEQWFGQLMYQERHTHLGRLLKTVSMSSRSFDYADRIVKLSAFKEANALFLVTGRGPGDLYYISASEIYVSNELHDAFKAAKVNAVEFKQTRETA
jgi:hypothetical protein